MGESEAEPVAGAAAAPSGVAAAWVSSTRYISARER